MKPGFLVFNMSVHSVCSVRRPRDVPPPTDITQLDLSKKPRLTFIQATDQEIKLVLFIFNRDGIYIDPA